MPTQKQIFDKKEKSILELDELFKGIGKEVALENKGINRQLEDLLKPSREILDSINQNIEDATKRRREILDLINQSIKGVIKPNLEINQFIEKTKKQYPKLNNFLKNTE